MTATATRDALATLCGVTDRIISISLIWPKQVRKTISSRDFADVIALNSAAVNPAYGSFTLVTLVSVTVSDSNTPWLPCVV